MNKLLVIGVFLFFSISSYILFSNIFVNNIEEYKTESDLDKRFEDVTKELENYGGAMIVKYDTETGEIISKRPAYPKDAGVFTVRTQEEANQVLGKVPDGVEVIIVEEDVSPARAIEYGGSN